MNQSIFKAYDIRGIYPEEINEKMAGKIGQALVNFLVAKLNKKASELKIVIGRDNRVASEPLAQAMIKVLLNNGVSVDDCGLISTNDYYFAMGYYGYDGGIMATASHNPPQYGGFKLTSKSLTTDNSFDFISGQALQVKEDDIMAFQTAAVKGELNSRDVSEDHLKHIFSFVDTNRIKPLKVVVDTGGGMTGLMIPKIFKNLPCELIHLFSELDSSFSSRPPNPLTEGAWGKISAKILAEKADLGMMFDVDGDRFFLLDERGNFIRGDMTLLLLAKTMLEKNSGSGIVYNLICSHSVKDLVKKWGGKPIRSEVGYMNLARHMKEEQGIMSGEVSGHFAFRDNFYSDNGFVALALALQTISEDGRPLSEIIKDYALYAKGDEINLKVENIAESLAKIRTHYRANILDEFDGITVEFNNDGSAMNPTLNRTVQGSGSWWFNVRASNTEPLLRVTVEAQNEAELKKRQDEILAIINS